MAWRRKENKSYETECSYLRPSKQFQKLLIFTHTLKLETTLWSCCTHFNPVSHPSPLFTPFSLDLSCILCSYSSGFLLIFVFLFSHGIVVLSGPRMAIINRRRNVLTAFLASREKEWGRKKLKLLAYQTSRRRLGALHSRSAITKLFFVALRYVPLLKYSTCTCLTYLHTIAWILSWTYK